MNGIDATDIEVKRNMDRLLVFLDPEKQLDFTEKLRGPVGTGCRAGFSSA